MGRKPLIWEGPVIWGQGLAYEYLGTLPPSCPTWERGRRGSSALLLHQLGAEEI